jgi:hypothetical protein
MRMIALLSTILASTALSYTPLLAGDKEEPVPQIIGSPKRAPTPTIPKGTPTEQVRALISQYDSAMAAFRRLYDSAKTDEDKAKAEPLYPQTQPYATLLMQIAEDNPKDSAAVDASSCSGLDRGFPMDVGPFLKEFVKRKRFSSGLLRSGSAGRKSRVYLAHKSRSIPRSYRCHFFGIRPGCRRYGKLRSFFSDAIAPYSFLRKVPLTIIAGSSARYRIRADADVSGANSSP